MSQDPVHWFCNDWRIDMGTYDSARIAFLAKYQFRWPYDDERLRGMLGPGVLKRMRACCVDGRTADDLIAAAEERELAAEEQDAEERDAESRRSANRMYARAIAKKARTQAHAP